MHVSPEASGGLTPSSDALITKFIEHDLHEGREGLDALSRRSGERNIECSVHLIPGRPADAVAKHVEDAGCDLVVVGTHGRSGLESLLLGSVAEKIVRSASAPTLCVRAGAAIAPGSTLVYGEDFTSTANREQVAALAKSLDATLVAVHAIEVTASAASGSGFTAPPELIDASLREAAERFWELSGEYGVETETEVSIGSASKAICDQARRRNASLVVTGTSSRKGLERWMLGSVAEKTLRRAPCSVLVLR